MHFEWTIVVRVVNTVDDSTKDTVPKVVSTVGGQARVTADGPTMTSRERVEKVTEVVDRRVVRDGRIVLIVLRLPVTLLFRI